MPPSAPSRALRARALARGLALGAALGLLPGCAPDAARPSVLLVVVDTLRADRLSCYGYPEPVSPELDELAAGGARFARVVSQSPWTRPSIGSLLSSLHPRALGIRSELGHVLPDVDTLAEAFRDAGYTTLGATANPNVNAAYEFDQGFDEYLDSTVLWTWMPREEGKASEEERAVQRAEEVFADLLEAVDRRSGPFYLQVNVMEVHEYLPGERDAAEVPAEELDGLYAAAVSEVSRAIGGLLDELAKRPGWEDRLVIVTSDHGEGLRDHPHVPDSEHHGNVLYESQLLVPLILADTGGRLPPGKVIERPVRLLDLAPTVLELAGLPPLAEAEGTSLVPLLSGADVQLPSSFVAETFFRGHDKIAVWSDGWLFVENRDAHPGTNRFELQATGAPQDGARTSKALERPEVLRGLAQHYRDWEATHPAATPRRRTRDLSAADLAQLRALGYVDEE